MFFKVAYVYVLFFGVYTHAESFIEYSKNNELCDIKLGGEVLPLSKDIFKQVDFSSQYSEDGALIKNIDFKSVSALKTLIEERYSTLLRGRKLEDRGEAHITVITPPEGKTDFFPNNIGIDQIVPTFEWIKKYKEATQAARFKIIGLGMLQKSNDPIVFYLVVDSPDLIKIRKEVAQILKAAGRSDIPFSPIEGFYPHITIGYIGNDIFDLPKDPKTIISNVALYE